MVEPHSQTEMTSLGMRLPHCRTNWHHCHCMHVLTTGYLFLLCSFLPPLHCGCPISLPSCLFPPPLLLLPPTLPPSLPPTLPPSYPPSSSYPPSLPPSLLPSLLNSSTQSSMPKEPLELAPVPPQPQPPQKEKTGRKLTIGGSTSLGKSKVSRTSSAPGECVRVRGWV